jgi:hypothetical protein
MCRDELQLRRILQRKTAPRSIRHPIDVESKKQFAGGVLVFECAIPGKAAKFNEKELRKSNLVKNGRSELLPIPLWVGG